MGPKLVVVAPQAGYQRQPRLVRRQTRSRRADPVEDICSAPRYRSRNGSNEVLISHPITSVAHAVLR